MESQSYVIILTLVHLVFDCHFAHTEAQTNIFFTDTKVTIFLAKGIAIFEIHVLFNLSEIFLVNPEKVVQIDFENVIHVESPKVLVAEFLPGVGVEVWEDAFVEEFGHAFVESFDVAWSSELFGGKAHNDF